MLRMSNQNVGKPCPDFWIWIKKFATRPLLVDHHVELFLTDDRFGQVEVTSKQDLVGWLLGHQKLVTLIITLESFLRSRKQKNTYALVWVKFPGLGVEFWEVDTLMALGRTLGTPIQIDHSSIIVDFGYFTKVLIDIDLAEPILSKILVEVDGGDLWQRIELGATPKFCGHYKIIGHTFMECRVIKEHVQRVEDPKKNQLEIPAPPKAFTKNQKKRMRKKKQREELNKGKGLLEETVDTREEVLDKIPHPLPDAEQDAMTHGELSNNSREASPVQQDELICNEQATTRAGRVEGEHLCTPPNSESSHQLLKETTIIKLQSALKWAYMVEDSERDMALIAHEGIWHNLGKEIHVNLKKTSKQKNVGSGEGKGYPNTWSNRKKLGNLWCLWKASFKDPDLVDVSSQHITIFYEGVLISAIHGMVSISTRRALWKDMEDLANLIFPWLALGDFNCIRNRGERSGGTGPIPSSITEFNDCIDSCRLFESSSTGPKFSW
ncbi:hypothetical protein GIB67_033559 [Kingdonia uniflora]|uniref:DUF4283 domain-containing protein n=1 Tax=Kingdonia uniflora TaxID=39325 RepID=A0A7J7L677_9MAGN|nr:hypothetical protein GIB67_033559 [Kingdonia uniflora]